MNSNFYYARCPNILWQIARSHDVTQLGHNYQQKRIQVVSSMGPFAPSPFARSRFAPSRFPLILGSGHFDLVWCVVSLVSHFAAFDFETEWADR